MPFNHKRKIASTDREHRMKNEKQKPKQTKKKISEEKNMLIANYEKWQRINVQY